MFSDALAVEASNRPDRPNHDIHTQPHLLTLPAEIRNAIFAYALSATIPLLYRPSPQSNTRGVFHEASQTRQFNQLKYVNRQLRAETEDLEMQHSEITFGHILYPKDQPALQPPELSSFVNLLPPRQLQWLTKVIVKPSPRSLGIIRNFHEMFRVWELCATHFQDHPHVSIKYFFPSLSSVHTENQVGGANPGRLIRVGMILMDVVRGHDLSYLKKEDLYFKRHHGYVKHQVRDWDVRELEKQLPNFRVFPYQEELSALWICNALNDMLGSYRSAALLQRWIVMAMEWIERGI